MRRRRIVERDEVLPAPAHVRLAAWRALHRPTVADMTPEDARASDASLMAWAAQYRAAMDAQADARIARLRQERKELQMQLETVVESRYTRAVAALAGVAVLLVSLLLPSVAQAQYQNGISSTAYAPNRYDVVARVDGACPGLIRQDHAFTDAVATVLNAEDARWGRNGKRGNANDPSHDAIAYRTSASPFGVAVIDIIGAAGSPSASPAWIDQTDATLAAGTTGVWVRPSGVLPPCLTGGSTPTPVDPIPIDSAIPIDYRPVLADISERLAIIDARLGALESREPSAPDLSALTRYVNDMVGSGPDGDGPLPPHITDLKERLDVLRVTLEQLQAWLRGRAVLRY